MSNQEYQIHGRVHELLKQLGVSNVETATAMQEYLEKAKTSGLVPAIMRVAEASPNPHDFLQKYDELKSRNARDLDSLVAFLAEIVDKPEVKHLFASAARSDTFDESSNLTVTNGSSGKLSSTALAEMKEKVMKTGGPVTLSPNILSSLSNKLSEKQLQQQQQQQQQNRPKKDVSGGGPEFSGWCHDRLHLSWDFYPNPDKFESDSELNKISVASQEGMIIDDLLNCMVGVEGKFIKTPSLLDRHAERTFHIDRSLDPAMRELAKRILPVCANYSLIVRFVEEKSHFKWGLVNHALCSAIKELLKNHYLFVAQLETLLRKGDLSLQKMWYYVNPVMGFMEILASIIKVINKGDCCGSAIINLLFEKVLIYSGDQSIQEMILYLAQTASKPYLQMLEEWIYRGQINDPYGEFMIVEDKEITKDKQSKDEFNEKFWEKKYSINRNNTPKFLTAISEKILLTGKYLNAIYETGKLIVRNEKELTGDGSDEAVVAPPNANESNMTLDNDENEQPIEIRLNNRSKIMIPNAVEVEFTMKEEFYKQIVHNAYNYSSKVLLNLLLKDHKLIDRLRSLKHYFLLDQSDFMVHFMDISEEEMVKEVSTIKESRLESLLELSLRITSANSDPYKDDLRVKLFKNDLKSLIMLVQKVDFPPDLKTDKTILDGLATFSLDYVIKWPLSLIINRGTLMKYQILFRHIFLIKDVERKLCNVWLCTKAGELCMGRSSRYYSMACALRQRMLNFVQNLLNYMTFEVFESSWSLFEESIMRKVTNVDDVIHHHNVFLDSCLRDCLITSVSFLTIHKILSTCVMLSAFIQGNTQKCRDKEESAKIDMKVSLKQGQEKRKQIISEIGDDLNKIVCGSDFGKTIIKYDKNFSDDLLELLAKIMDENSGSGLGETKIGNVLYRLDFNDHYRDQIEKKRQKESEEKLAAASAVAFKMTKMPK